MKSHRSMGPADRAARLFGILVCGLLVAGVWAPSAVLADSPGNDLSQTCYTFSRNQTSPYGSLNSSARPNTVTLVPLPSGIDHWESLALRHGGTWYSFEHPVSGTAYWGAAQAINEWTVCFWATAPTTTTTASTTTTTAPTTTTTAPTTTTTEASTTTTTAPTTTTDEASTATTTEASTATTADPTAATTEASTTTTEPSATTSGGGDVLGNATETTVTGVDNLPFTGMEVSYALLTAMSLLICGVVLVMGRDRRRPGVDNRDKS